MWCKLPVKLIAPSECPYIRGKAAMNLGTNESGFSEEPPDGYRLSRHASRYKGDLRTSSTAVLDTPMLAMRSPVSGKAEGFI